MSQREDPATTEEKDEALFAPGLACGDFGCWPYALTTFDEFLKTKAEPEGHPEHPEGHEGHPEGHPS